MTEKPREITICHKQGCEICNALFAAKAEREPGAGPEPLPLFQPPGLDGLDLADVLELERVFHTLYHYTRNRARAMEQRLAGNIDLALKIEEVAEKYYAALPKQYQW